MQVHSRTNGVRGEMEDLLQRGTTLFAEQRGGKKVYLDARKIGANFAKRFPGILALCAARGIDPRKDLIPVTPAAHYMMGGVSTDLNGRSSMARPS